jgi:hypothetical protein
MLAYSDWWNLPATKPGHVPRPKPDRG